MENTHWQKSKQKTINTMWNTMVKSWEEMMEIRCITLHALQYAFLLKDFYVVILQKNK